MPADARRMTFDAETFIAALKSIAGAQSTDESRYVLNGVCLEIGADAVRFVSTDGRRLFMAELTGGNSDPETVAKISAAQLAVDEAQLNKDIADEAVKTAVGKFPAVYSEITAPHWVDSEKFPKVFAQVAGPEVLAAQAGVKDATEVFETAQGILAKLKTACQVLLPSNAVKHILRIPLEKRREGNPFQTLTLTHWTVKAPSKDLSDSHYARVDCGAFAVLTKQIDGNYPNFRVVIPAADSCKERITVVTQELRAALVIAEKGTSEKANSVKLQFGKNNVTITGSSPEIGEAKAQMAINYRGKEFAIAFNPAYFISACDAFAAHDEMILEFIDELCPVKIVSHDGKLHAVIMPMRLS
jgi:DNA polymerase III sliding clamp (beta) subunit (PCNA family)